ncbi:MAG: radical SAM protein [Bacilli bacterium]|nr:radical SAM protein [Bacilli bacterium]
MEQIKLFNQQLTVKNELCSEDPKDIKLSSSKLRLYIKLTDDCNAHCGFCANQNSQDYGNIDMDKLKYVITYLLSKDKLHGISITGGEPLTHPDKLFQIFDLIYKLNPNIEVQLSTNGYNLLKLLEYDNINKLESIHISKHHYNDEINYEIFKSKNIASSDDISKLSQSLEDKQIININTIIMKEYISNLKEIKNMLEHTAQLGVYKNGFVSLIRCNEFAKQKYINFNEIFNNLDKSFFKGHHFYHRNYCECLCGMYLTKNNKLIEFYARMINNNPCPYTSQLVYTSDNKVTAGFSKKIIYK